MKAIFSGMKTFFLWGGYLAGLYALFFGAPILDPPLSYLFTGSVALEFLLLWQARYKAQQTVVPGTDTPEAAEIALYRAYGVALPDMEKEAEKTGAAVIKTIPWQRKAASVAYGTVALSVFSLLLLYLDIPPLRELLSPYLADMPLARNLFVYLGFAALAVGLACERCAARHVRARQAASADAPPGRRDPFASPRFFTQPHGRSCGRQPERRT
jgi:hypothetical protein